MTFEEMKAVARQIATNLGLSAEMRAAGAEELVAEAWRAGLAQGRAEQIPESLRKEYTRLDQSWQTLVRERDDARRDIRELNAEIARLSDENTKLKERGFVP